MQGLSFLSQHIFQSKMRLSIKTAVYAHIGTVNFVIQFKESSCSPVVSFPSFGSEGHGVQSPQGNSFFFLLLCLCWSPLIFFVQCSCFFFQFQPSQVWKDLLRKDIKHFLTVKYIHLAMYFLIQAAFYQLVSNRQRPAKVWILIGRSFSYLGKIYKCTSKTYH